jgi:hypothetical protein
VVAVPREAMLLAAVLEAVVGSTEEAAVGAAGALAVAVRVRSDSHRAVRVPTDPSATPWATPSTSHKSPVRRIGSFFEALETVERIA